MTVMAPAAWVVRCGRPGKVAAKWASWAVSAYAPAEPGEDAATGRGETRGRRALPPAPRSRLSGAPSPRRSASQTVNVIPARLARPAASCHCCSDPGSGGRGTAGAADAGHDDRRAAGRAAGFPAWPAVVIELRSGEAGAESWTYMAGAPHVTL